MDTTNDTEILADKLEASTGTLKAGVRFQRTVALRPYESAVASIYIEFDTGDNPSVVGDPDFIARAKGAFQNAKALVYEQLGLEFKVEDGVVMEVLRDHFGPVETRHVADPVAQAQAPAAKAAAARPLNSYRFSGGRDVPQDQVDAAVADLLANPSGWYDNRSDKRNPKAPDFKRKSDGFALWAR